MSLKAFHLVFIVAAIALAGVVGAWAWGHRAVGSSYLMLAVVCFAAAAGLVVYGIWFVKKLKDVSYL